MVLDANVTLNGPTVSSPALPPKDETLLPCRGREGKANGGQISDQFLAHICHFGESVIFPGPGNP